MLSLRVYMIQPHKEYEIMRGDRWSLCQGHLTAIRPIITGNKVDSKHNSHRVRARSPGPGGLSRWRLEGSIPGAWAGIAAGALGGLAGFPLAAFLQGRD